MCEQCVEIWEARKALGPDTRKHSKEFDNVRHRFFIAGMNLYEFTPEIAATIADLVMEATEDHASPEKLPPWNPDRVAANVLRDKALAFSQAKSLGVKATFEQWMRGEAVEEIERFTENLTKQMLDKLLSFIEGSSRSSTLPKPPKMMS